MSTHHAGADTALKDRRVATPTRKVGSPEAPKPPVFVDATGRRERLWRRLSLLVAAAAAAYVMAVTSSFLATPVEPQGPPPDLDGARSELTGELTAPPALRVEND